MRELCWQLSRREVHGDVEEDSTYELSAAPDFAERASVVLSVHLATVNGELNSWSFFSNDLQQINGDYRYVCLLLHSDSQ